MLNAPVAEIGIDRSPDLQIGGLSLWVHGRQYPAAHDKWDGNWLEVTAECKHPSSMIRVEGPILTVPEVEGLLAGCISMQETLSGKASLDCMEPNLSVAMEVVGSSGHIRLTVEITPDNVSEEHRYCDEIDQSFLPAIIDGCRAILQRYPKRGGLPE